MKNTILTLLAIFTSIVGFTQNKSFGIDYDDWIVGVSLNGVDIKDSKDYGSGLKDYFSFDDVNFSGFPIKISLDKKISESFLIQVASSFNNIKKDYLWNTSKINREQKFLGFDAKLKYDLNSVFGLTGSFDPFLDAGFGVAKFSNETIFNLKVGYGFTYWLSNDWGARVNSGYNHNFKDEKYNFFQHAVGIVYKFKLGQDADGDTVKDDVDECPEVFGLSKHNGCPDSDDDGIKDADDDCINQAGIERTKGCPDSDKDGVADDVDKCPKEEGPSENEGCPWGDADKDGITDNIDQCPSEFGVAANKGCPEVKVEEPKEDNVSTAVSESQSVVDCSDKIREINNTKVYFDSDSYQLKSNEQSKLDNIYEIFKFLKCDLKKVVVTGFADPVGSSLYNLKLSKKRAKKVKTYLEKLGVKVKLNEVGLGETNSSQDDFQNRRVEFKVE